MRKHIQSLIVLFICCTSSLFTISSAYAEPTPLKNIVILGDSLSDNGNLYRGNVAWWVPVPAYFIPKPPYHEGRFSNGPIWADRLADLMESRDIKTTNYAAGGALINWHLGLYMPYTLQNMMDRFFELESWADRLDDTLFIVWIGANDYLNGVQYFSDVDKDTNYTIETLGNNLAELIEKGGKQFLLINLPDISRAPARAQSENKIILQQLVNAHNKKLNQLKDTFSNLYLSRDIQIQVLDSYALVNDVIYDPVEFNRKHGTNLNIQYIDIPCWTGSYRFAHNMDKDIATIHQSLNRLGLHSTEENKQIAESIAASPDLYEAWSTQRQYSLRKGVQCANPDSYMFWDKLHPTTAMHGAIYQLVLEMMNEHWS